MTKRRLISIFILIVLTLSATVVFSGCEDFVWPFPTYVYQGETGEMRFALDRDNKTATLHYIHCVKSDEPFEIPSQVEYEDEIYTVTTLEPELTLWGYQPCFTSWEIRELIVPASIEKLELGYRTEDSVLEKVTVHPDNKTYKSIDGVVYTKDGMGLVYYPPRKKGSTFTIPKEMCTVAVSDFKYRTYFFSFATFDDVYVEEGNIAYKNIDGVLYNFDETKILHYSKTKTDPVFIVPKNVVTISSLYNVNLKKIEVETGNLSFKSIDGILYSFDVTKIIYYPRAHEMQHYIMPSSLEHINEYDLSVQIKNLKTIYIPSSIKEINYPNLPDQVEIYIESNELPNEWKFMSQDKIHYNVSLNEYQNIISTWEETGKQVAVSALL